MSLIYHLKAYLWKTYRETYNSCLLNLYLFDGAREWAGIADGEKKSWKRVVSIGINEYFGAVRKFTLKGNCGKSGSHIGAWEFTLKWQRLVKPPWGFNAPSSNHTSHLEPRINLNFRTIVDFWFSYLVGSLNILHSYYSERGERIKLENMKNN